MIVYNNLSEYNEEYSTVVTVGNFDGIHLGHKKILEKVNSIAGQYNFKSVVFTFEPHPLKYFGADVPMILTPSQKQKLLDEMGMDFLFQIEFSDQFAKMTPEVFVREVLVKKLNARFIIVGYDYKFGRRRKGDFKLLQFLSQHYGYTPFKVDRVEIGGEVVSSTNIRKFLQEGKIKKANEMLGRNFSLEGTVVQGSKIGRLLGYPTANILVNNEILPKLGVYVSRLTLKGVKYDSVTNIGIRPTINDEGEDVKVEAFIFDFNEDLYGEEVELELLEYLRPEARLDSFEELKNVIKADCRAAKKIHAEMK